MRRALDTTNAIDNLQMQLRKIIKSHGHFANDESAIKLSYLALTKIGQKCRRSNSTAFAIQSFLHECSVAARRDHLEFVLEVMGVGR